MFFQSNVDGSKFVFVDINNYFSVEIYNNYSFRYQ